VNDLQTPASREHRYTFGDNGRASARLQRLAEVYEPDTRALLERSGMRAPRLAVDLGCGPGWSTRLLRDVLAPQRTVGLDASATYVAEAQRRHGPELEFAVHDIVRSPFPVSAPDVMFCRFLLTHLRSLNEVLTGWAEVAAAGGWLLIHETETLESEHPALQRYYELVDRLQRHHGQILRVGGVLEAAFAGTGWRLIESQRCRLEKPLHVMAELHLANLRTWRQDEFAARTFDPREIDNLALSLAEVAADRENHGVVLNIARQIVAERAIYSRSPCL
jgi:SAM-dependent methyltransferase